MMYTIYYLNTAPKHWASHYKGIVDTQSFSNVRHLILIAFLCNREWDIELDKASRDKKESKVKPSLLRAIWATFGIEYMFYGVFTCVEECGFR